MSVISTHILDTARGRPAAGITVILERIGDDGAAVPVGQASTDEEGRIRQMVPASFSFEPGSYRLTFETGVYFASLHVDSFYPRVFVLFTVQDRAGHYHVPLLLSPFGYSTYRGA